jgi:hypothetical protein
VTVHGRYGINYYQVGRNSHHEHNTCRKNAIITDYKQKVGSNQCCGPGSGIRCLFDPWIWDPRWGKNQDPDPG